ncbi:MAG: hypothetical protein KAI16_02825 [Candidatus Pacebacteria bacterium]|nr:hypothetical protein [Candidatus Paceibacterota bacterium]
MDVIGIIIISPLWGSISTQLFLQSWLSFIGLIINIIGIIRGKVERKNTFLGLSVSFAQMLLFFGLLCLGNYLLTSVFSFGYTKTENIIYWIFAVVNLLFMLPQFPAKIKKMWRNANVAGSLESDIMERKLRNIEN